MAYTVEAGNVHDSQAFPALFSKLESFSPHYIIADSGYKTPAIAHYLLERNIIPVFPYTRPKGVKGNLRPSNFVYDASYDHYVCPENQVLAIAQPLEKATVSIRVILKVCVSCPLLSICTQSKNFQKVVTRHVWKDALEFCEEIRHQREMKELYKKRKETIERLFGTAKEYHNLRYTREKGKSKMEDQVGLTLACLNIKKLVKWIGNIPFYFSQIQIFG